MTAAAVIAALCLPSEVRVDQRVPKKLLLENSAPTAADKRQINDGIEDLHWVAALKPGTIGIPVFRDANREYLEIAVLSVTLRAGAKAARLTELIHRAIPYPILLILNEPLGISLSLCHLRWSQNQAGRMVLDGSPSRALLETGHSSCAPFLAAIHVSSQPRTDLHAFYEGWLHCVDAHAAAQVTSTFTLCETSLAEDARRAALADYDRLNREIASLRAKAGKESQLNRRVAINLEIKNLQALQSQALSAI